MIRNDLKSGTPVLYVKGTNHIELGIIKRRNNTDDGYFVRYHTGDTAASTPDRLLAPIENVYAFQVIRKDVNNEIQSQKARRIAHEVIKKLEEYVGIHYGDQLLNNGSEGDEDFTKGLLGDSYYNLEDIITRAIEEYED